MCFSSSGDTYADMVSLLECCTWQVELCVQQALGPAFEARAGQDVFPWPQKVFVQKTVHMTSQLPAGLPLLVRRKGGIYTRGKSKQRVFAAKGSTVTPKSRPSREVGKRGGGHPRSAQSASEMGLKRTAPENGMGERSAQRHPWILFCLVPFCSFHC